MKGWTTALVVAMSCSTTLRADVTLTMTSSVEGPMAALAANAVPRLNVRIQGMKARNEVEVRGQILAMIIDLETKQVTTLNTVQKIAQVWNVEALQALQGAAPAAAMPALETRVEPTGRTQDIAGQQCEEYNVAMSLDLGQMSASPQIPKEAVEMMKAVKMTMTGAMWVSKSAPGATEYIAFQKAAREMNLSSAANPVGGNSFDPVIRAFALSEGIPCLSELQTSFEGASPMIETLKRMGAVKVISRLSDVSVAPIAADLFVIPSDYAVSKPQ